MSKALGINLKIHFGRVRYRCHPDIPLKLFVVLYQLIQKIWNFLWVIVG